MQPRSRLGASDQIARIANQEAQRVLAKAPAAVRTTSSRVLGSGVSSSPSTGAGYNADSNSNYSTLSVGGVVVSAKRIGIGSGLVVSSPAARTNQAVISSVAIFDPVALMLQ